MLSKQQKEKITNLVKSFGDEKAHQKSEEHIQSLFTIKLLEVLGWTSSQFKINQGQDVNTGKKPDILLQCNGDTLLVIESKEASNKNTLDGSYSKSGTKTTFVEQLRNYGKAEGVYWGILTNFIEWRVYNLFQNRLYLNKKFAFHDLLWNGADKRHYVDILSKEGFNFLNKLSTNALIPAKGVWDEDPIYYPLQEDIKGKFFSDLQTWRQLLCYDISKNNKNFVTGRIESFAQKIIDRLIFIDYCSDNRIITQDRLHASLEARSKIYEELKRIFQTMDERFNSELFAPGMVDKLSVSDDVLRQIILSLADIDFSKLSVNVMGEVYERYLGEIQRSGQGIYYTPEHIVNYIVENTVGSVLTKCKSIEEIEKIRVLDPACGSGSFLIRIFDEFLKHYKRFENAPLFEFNLRKKILLNNIFAVDIDERAVEITKLNLLVKALEGAARYNITGKKILPNIKLNIRCGNSIVSGAAVLGDLSQYYQDFESEFRELEKLHMDFMAQVDENRQIQISDRLATIEACLNRNLSLDSAEISDPQSVRPFNYEVAFPQVFKNGGFDCVIGNPPYIDSERMTLEQPEIREFVSTHMKYTKGNWDIYIAFFERAFDLAKAGGYIGYITPDKWISKDFGKTLRIGTAQNILSLMRAGRDVFKDATVDAVVSIFSKNNNPKLSVFEVSKHDISEIVSIDKKKMKPAHKYDQLFSKHIGIIGKISAAGSAKSPGFLCENACATSDCYKLKPYIVDHETDQIDPGIYYKVINTGTVGRYISRWGLKEMTYLKTKYRFPVVHKAVFHEYFENTYAIKARKPKLILKSLTLLDATIDYAGDYIPGKSTLVVTTEKELLEFYAAIFNSKIAFFFLSESYPSSSYNGGIAFTKDMLNEFPVPLVQKSVIKSVSNLVQSISKETDRAKTLSSEGMENCQVAIKSIQYELDSLIYKLYNLDSREREIIERYTSS